MYAATRGPNVKWGGTYFKWGGLEPLAPMLATALLCCTPVYINIFKEAFLKKIYKNFKEAKKESQSTYLLS